MATGTLVAIKALLANGEIARFGLRFAWTGGVAPTIADLEIVATAAQTELNSHTALYCPDTLLGLCTAQNFTHVPAVGTYPYDDPGEHAPYWAPTTGEVLSTVASVPGTAAGLSASPQVALAVTLRTANSGRSRLGRVFTFPPPEARVSAAGIVDDAGDRAAMVEDIIGVVTAAALSAGDPLIGSVFSAALNLSTPIVSVVANDRVDTQRRRLQR